MTYEYSEKAEASVKEPISKERIAIISEIMLNNKHLSDVEQVKLFDKLCDKSLSHLKIFYKVFK